MRSPLLSVHDDEGGFDAAMCCEACRADTAFGDHEPGCVNETMDLALVEALAASAGGPSVSAPSNPVISLRKMPMTRQIPARTPPCMTPEHSFSTGGGR